ncbi:MAG: GNAT family N-acetyltransferase [Armatimonadota bacterium]
MSNFEIRPPASAEVGYVVQFIQELAEYERLSHECQITEEALRTSLFAEHPHVEARLAILDGVPIGFCLFFHNFSTFLGKPGLYLEDLYIQPQYRNSGYGKQILGYLANLAIERGCGRFEWAVLDWNEPSIAFYRKIGAEPMNDWTVQRLTGDSLAQLASTISGVSDV